MTASMCGKKVTAKIVAPGTSMTQIGAPHSRRSAKTGVQGYYYKVLRTRSNDGGVIV